MNELITEAQKSNLNQIARILHLLACGCPHEDSIGERNVIEEAEQGILCYWYLEEQRSDCWECEDHKKWLNDAEVFLKFFEDDEEKARKTLTSLMDICSKISFVLKSCKGLESVILKIIRKALTT